MQKPKAWVQKTVHLQKSRSNIRKKLKIEDNKRTSISEYILKEKMNIDLQP